MASRSVSPPYNELVKHLSSEDRKLLAKAVKQAHEDFYDDQLGKQVRRERVDELLREIIGHAKENGDNERDLEEWEDDFQQLFLAAGETDYMFDRFEERLEWILGFVEAGRRVSCVFLQLFVFPIRI